jgi:hypothetical protein
MIKGKFFGGENWDGAWIESSWRLQREIVEIRVKAFGLGFRQWLLEKCSKVWNKSSFEAALSFLPKFLRKLLQSNRNFHFPPLKFPFPRAQAQNIFRFLLLGESAMEWEDRLMEEMCRLTQELEQVHLDERNSALNKLKAEHLVEIQAMAAKFKQDEQKLLDDVIIKLSLE